MPKTRKQKLVYAFITVLITVPCFVFYCSSYETGGFNIDIIKNSWIFIPIELVLAYFSAVFIGSPLALKIAFKAVNPKKTDPFIVDIVIICATVLVMCPWMSFLATILYNGIIDVLMNGGSLKYLLINFIPFWLEKVVLNFPFALISQLFIIQPITKIIFKKICK